MTIASNSRPDQECAHEWRSVTQQFSEGRVQLNLSCRKCRYTIVEIYNITKKYIIDKQGRFIDAVNYRLKGDK